MVQARFMLVCIAVLTACGNQSASAIEPTWRPFLPGNRTKHAIAYDSQRGVLVLFGGITDLGLEEQKIHGDTWEWDGQSWKRRIATGPAPRAFHKMAYDAARGVVVLTGGFDAADNPLSETWEWDGASWTLKSNAARGANESAMGYDPISQRVLFVGPGQTTSAWDGSTWTDIDNTLPNGSQFVDLALDTNRNVLLLVRRTISTEPAEIWEWTGVTWTLVSNTGPDQLDFTAAFDAARNVLVLSGAHFPQGSNDTRRSETWEWNGSTWTLAGDGLYSFPYDQYVAPLIYHQAIGRVVGSAYGLVSWVGSAWQEHSPGLVAHHAMAYDRARRETIVFGGVRFTSPDTTVFGNTWALTEKGWTLKATDGPAPRSGHKMTYDTKRNVVVLTGGEGADGTRYKDLWEWDGSAWTQIAADGGPAYHEFHLSFDEQAGTVVLVKGISVFAAPPHHVWEWDGVSWSNTGALGGSFPLYSGDLFFDEADQAMTVIAVYHDASVYEYKRTAGVWNITPLTGVQFFSSYPMCAEYDAQRQCAVMWGDVAELPNPVHSAGTWEWDGSNATFIGYVGPRPRQIGHSTTVYDRDRRLTVQFGGKMLSNQLSADAWVYGTGIPGDFELDGDVDFSDFALFSQCYGGALNPIPASCPDDQIADFDGDGDVDLGDFAEFAANYTGAR